MPERCTPTLNIGVAICCPLLEATNITVLCIIMYALPVHGFLALKPWKEEVERESQRTEPHLERKGPPVLRPKQHSVPNIPEQTKKQFAHGTFRSGAM